MQSTPVSPKYGNGRIGDIVTYLKTTFNVEDVTTISTEDKLNALCGSLNFTYDQLDRLISQNSPVLRTIKGHAFETVFAYILRKNGLDVKTVGGDGGTDLIINGHMLQLKTPYSAGTDYQKRVVSYKTHKTHGAKSEKESEEYYYDIEKFADYLVGLISYAPFNVLVLSKDEIPKHPIYHNRILSPFLISWDNHPALNALARIGIKATNLTYISQLISDKEKELLPLTAEIMDLTTDLIVNTILQDGNFRIWDMNVRGFAREIAFNDFLTSHGISIHKPQECNKERADKSDFALFGSGQNICKLFQVKGVSSSYCTFSGKDCVVGVETQLTRGRINDHPTQSRLYLSSDFDFLLLVIDPPLVEQYHLSMKSTELSGWEYFIIPTEELNKHSKFPNRIKPIQIFKYSELQRYKVTDNWLKNWI